MLATDVADARGRSHAIVVAICDLQIPTPRMRLVWLLVAYPVPDKCEPCHSSGQIRSPFCIIRAMRGEGGKARQRSVRLGKLDAAVRTRCAQHLRHRYPLLQQNPSLTIPSQALS